MKIRELVLKLYKAIIKRDIKREKKLYDKITKKSLKHKHTEVVN